MAQLLIRSLDGENAKRFMDGDVVTVVDDSHIWGRMESFTTWVSEGNTPENWPGGFVIVKLPDLTVEQAKQFVAEGDVRRLWSVAYPEMERRAPDSGRDTLNTEMQITRQFEEVETLFELK